MIKIAISCGDPAGIGYEVAAKSLLRYHPRDVQYILFGERSVFEKLAGQYRWAQSFMNSIDSAEFQLISSDNGENYPTGVIDARCGEIAYRSVVSAIKAANGSDESRKCDAIVTAPISKKALHLAGHKFDGHTGILSKIFDVPVTMMLFTRGFRVSLATTHIPLRNVPGSLTPELLAGHLARTRDALANWFGIENPVIGVLALNPHAGESGILGDEESIIDEAIESAKNGGITAEGPLVPDVAFLTKPRRRYDAYLAMYHDQGLIPLKTLGFRRGVNITLGLPVPRTSPDHGTAFDIAGKGIANPLSFIEALKTAVKIARRIGARHFQKFVPSIM